MERQMDSQQHYSFTKRWCFSNTDLYAKPPPKRDPRYAAKPAYSQNNVTCAVNLVDTARNQWKATTPRGGALEGP